MTRKALLLVTVAWMATAVPALAQSVGIRHAVYIAATPDSPAHVELVLEAIFETVDAVAAAQDTRKYRVIDLYGGKDRAFAPAELSVARAVVPALAWLPAERLDTVQLFLAGDLPAREDDRYLVIVSGLSIGSDAVPVSASPAAVTMRLAAPGAVAQQLGQALDRDTADLYFSGAISRSAGTDFYGSADIKARYPAVQKKIGRRLHYFAPTFDLLASADPDADPDSLALGAAWQFFPIARNAGLLPITRWENAFEHESSRDFDYRTLVWRSEWLLLPSPWRFTEDARLWINPVVGLAAGRILEVPEGAFDRGALFRIMGGVGATIQLRGFFGKTLSLQGEYQVRRQYQDELAGEVTLGKGSHPWTSLKAELAFNDYVSLGATYQDGELPPTYTAVHDSLTLDLTFKAAMRNKPR